MRTLVYTIGILLLPRFMRIYWLCIFSLVLSARLQAQTFFLDYALESAPCDTAGGSIRLIPSDPTKRYTYAMVSNDCGFPLRPLQDSAVFRGLPPCRYNFKVYDEFGDSALVLGIKLGLQISGFLVFTCDTLEPLTFYRFFSFHNGKAPYTVRARKGSVWLPDVLIITSDSSVSVLDTLKDRSIQYYVIDSCGDSDFIPIPFETGTPLLDQRILCDDTQILNFSLLQNRADWEKLNLNLLWKMNGNVLSDSSTLVLPPPLQSGEVRIRINYNSCVFNYFHDLIPRPSNLINLQLSTDKATLCANDSALLSASLNFSRPTKLRWNNGDSVLSIRAHNAGVYSVIAENNNGCRDTATIAIGSSSMQMSSTITNNLCFGQANAAIELDFSGGSLPLSYQWSDNNATTEDRTNLTNGTYHVRVMDSALCALEDSFVITSPPALLLMLTATAADCAIAKNGKVTTQVQGGVAPYTYQWSNGLTVPNVDTLSPGNYTFTVIDSNGCTSPFTFGIGELAPFASNRIDTICANGSIRVGSSTYNLTGRYSDTLVNFRGCDSIVTTFLTVNLPVDFNLNAVPPGCDDRNDGRINILNPMGIPGFTYFLNEKPLNSTQATGLGAGNYVVRMHDRFGCRAEKGIALPQPEKVQMTLGRDTLIHYGDTLELSIKTNLNANNIRNVQWTTNPSIGNCMTCGPEYSYLPMSDHVIKAVVEGVSGCKAEDEIYVRVSREFKVFVPNIFVPSSQNPENQLLTIKGGNQISQIKFFRIFNRYGDRVFEAQNFLPDDFLQGWDGRFRNADAASDVYVYVIDLVFLDGTEKLIKGDFVLMR